MERKGQMGQRVLLGLGPSAERREGRAETRSGRGQAKTPSANSPDSCMKERERTRENNDITLKKEVTDTPSMYIYFRFQTPESQPNSYYLVRLQMTCHSVSLLNYKNTVMISIEPNLAITEFKLVTDIISLKTQPVNLKYFT